MKTHMVVFEVYRDSPVGDYIMGLFLYRKDAEKCMNSWNAEHKHPWDVAAIYERKVLVEDDEVDSN